METEKEGLDSYWSLSEFKYDKENGIFVSPEQRVHTINYSDGPKTEDYILNAIKNAKEINNDSEELMHAVKDWPSYYHLGIGRSNILKCLELSDNIKILEFGSGCGATTRYLGENFELVDAIEGSPLRAQITRERCRDLENVRVICSNVKHIKFAPIYDIVTLIGVLEYAPLYITDQINVKESCLSLLKLAKTALSENGALIIAIENKIGLKYWSGCPEDHTRKMFDSLHGYTGNRILATFSKKELEALLKATGFSNISFYYCFPDYKFASTIFSDIGIEKGYYLHNWIDVPFISYNLQRDHIFHEGLVNKTLYEAELLGEFANSFLVVASQGKSDIIKKSDWIAKKFSLKRRKKFSCITTARINQKPYIEKKRIFGDKENHIIVSNKIKIKQIVNDSPWYEGDLLTIDIFKAICENNFKRKLLEILEIYHKELINRYYTGMDDEEGYPLLKGESFDFHFGNLIKNRTGKLYHIDTEWVAEKYIPADFVIYRAIIYDITSERQRPWMRKRIRNTKKFTIELIKSFFPNYGKKRNNKNKLLEDSFQDLVMVRTGLHHKTLTKKFKFLRKK
ncbi:MAG TPA: class I SAM-dependent methyltransferase [Nitrospinota bacterium]|nr:class I SAM-dependent methyltransferase [Nitrospinota bacterium]